MSIIPAQMSWVLEPADRPLTAGEPLVWSADGGSTRRDVLVADPEVCRIGPGPLKVRVKLPRRTRYVPLAELYREVHP